MWAAESRSGHALWTVLTAPTTPGMPGGRAYAASVNDTRHQRWVILGGLIRRLRAVRHLDIRRWRPRTCSARPFDADNTQVFRGGRGVRRQGAIGSPPVRRQQRHLAVNQDTWEVRRDAGHRHPSHLHRRLSFARANVPERLLRHLPATRMVAVLVASSGSASRSDAIPATTRGPSRRHALHHAVTCARRGRFPIGFRPRMRAAPALPIPCTTGSCSSAASTTIRLVTAVDSRLWILGESASGAWRILRPGLPPARYGASGCLRPHAAAHR